MYGPFRALLLCSALCLSMPSPVASDEISLMRPLGVTGRYTFVPNQLAAARWYKPAGQLVNGYIQESFGNKGNWPQLRRFLQQTNGAFGLFAAEIGYLTSDWLLDLRRIGIGVSVETPAWTQCASGIELARADLFGSPVDGRNIFQSIFRIDDTIGRSDPFRSGWFFTRDGQDYAPDEIVLDHRILSLLPSFDNATLLTSSPGLSWQTRKDAARRDPCPRAESFHSPYVDRVEGVLLDYVDYARISAQKFPSRPAFSFHWNVVPLWEWSDEQCLDVLHELHPNIASFANAFLHLERPCHRDTAILDRLVDMLCQASACPATVFMDIDLTYQTAYALDVLHRDREVLHKHGVAFGIDLVDQCETQIACVQVAVAPGQLRQELKTADDVHSENMLYQQSLLNKFRFLVDNGIIDQDTHVRFESWSTRPVETKNETAENKQGSFANTVLLLTREFIVQHGRPEEQER